MFVNDMPLIMSTQMFNTNLSTVVNREGVHTHVREYHVQLKSPCCNRRKINNGGNVRVCVEQCNDAHTPVIS